MRKKTPITGPTIEELVEFRPPSSRREVREMIRVELAPLAERISALESAAAALKARVAYLNRYTKEQP